MSDEFSSQLEQWLNSTADRYDVAQTIKESPAEKTQVVYRRNDKGERIGPFVRKVFAGGEHRGLAYERILRAQTSGHRLTHQPFVYECEHTGNTLEVVMEYIHGNTLFDAVDKFMPAAQEAPGTTRNETSFDAVDKFAAKAPEAPGTTSNETLFRSVAIPLCEAVSELHETFESPIIHRDIKPSNVMLANGQVFLIDLGIARTWRKDAPRDTVRYGTPGYAPPEQFGYGQTSVRSDVYALGMTLAFCLLGEDPTSELRESGFADPRIPATLRPALARATQFDPNARYASARELASDVLLALQQTASAPNSSHAGSPANAFASNIADNPMRGAGSGFASGTANNPAHGAGSSFAGGTANNPMRGAGSSFANGTANNPTRGHEGGFSGGLTTSSEDRPVDGLSTRTADDPTTSSPPANKPLRFELLGKIWNTALGAVWFLLFVVTIYVIVSPGDGTGIAAYPPWFRLFAYLFMWLVPLSSVFYLALDKRRLREHPLFAGRTTLQEFLVLFFVSIISVVGTAIIYGRIVMPAIGG